MAKGRKISDIEIIDIADMYVRGCTLGQIARETGLAKNTVFNAVHHNPKCREHMETITETYKSELLALAIDTVKDALLDENLNEYTKPQYLKFAFQYSGAEQGASNINVTNTKVDIGEISFDELKQLKYK